MQSILSTFGIDNETYLRHKISTTSFLREKNPYHSISISPDQDQYWLEWGADKALIHLFASFLKELNLSELAPGVECRAGIHFVNPDRTLLFTISNPDYKRDYGYLHYVGVTGTEEEALKCFTLFQRMGTEQGMSFGGRNFI
jgi:hypothetical protein